MRLRYKGQVLFFLIDLKFFVDLFVGHERGLLVTDRTLSSNTRTIESTTKDFGTITTSGHFADIENGSSSLFDIS